MVLIQKNTHKIPKHIPEMKKNRNIIGILNDKHTIDARLNRFL